jgi:hypothetical protein
MPILKILVVEYDFPRAGELKKKSLWELGTEEEKGYRTGPTELEFLKSLWGLGTEEE